ncbi:MAG: hypothetical protein J1E85_05110 [Ruminococcus sp.]|nr:hypothetical protein [Ruminococcus sp.]
MESYIEFLNRINSFQKSELVLDNSNFNPNASVFSKVDDNNKFSLFYGDTVVFELSSNLKKSIAEIVDKLYEYAPECFCDRLVSNTFHMTLHDLSNSPVLDEVSSEVFKNEINLIEKLKSTPVEKQTIKMKSTYIFNMVNTSLVLGLYPIDATEYTKLMNLYNIVNYVKSLPYPFTPHITLAYYNRNGFSEVSARKLEAIVNELNKNSFEIELNTNDLVYQKFTSMNDYTSIFTL